MFSLWDAWRNNVPRLQKYKWENAGAVIPFIAELTLSPLH